MISIPKSLAILVKRLIFLGFLFPATSHCLAEEVNQNWVQMDKRVILELSTVLKRNIQSYEDFKKSMKNQDVRENRDIGFGLHRYICAVYGGYVSNWITVIGFAGRHYGYQIRSYVGGRNQTVIDSVKKFWGDIGDLDSDGVVIRNTFADVAKASDSSIAKEIGAKVEMDSSESSNPAYVFLSSPYKYHRYGNRCYEAAIVPEGRKSIEILLKTRQYKLIRNVLRSPNPESRLYAYMIICENKDKIPELYNAESEALNTLKNQKIEISCCNGCMVDMLPMSKLVK